jgi:hypothetical protein
VSADEKIMEKNMIVLQNDFKSLAYKTVPYKETSLKIGGGTLTVHNASSSATSPTFDIYDDAGTKYVESFRFGDLRYESHNAQKEISLQNGAVMMRDTSAPGSTLLAEPRWFYDSMTNTMVVNLISVNSTGLMAKEGIETMQMALGRTGYTSANIPPGVHLYVQYTPEVGGQDYSAAWDGYFANTMGLAAAVPPHTFEFPTSSSPAVLVIKKYDIMISSL